MRGVIDPASSPAAEAGLAREAQRQQQLLDALFASDTAASRDALPGWPRGVAAYRVNAAAHAAQVLRAQHPTVLAMLGGDAFDALALRLAPATRLLEADWAVVALRELHAATEPDTDAIAQAVRAAPQAAWVWREGFDARCVAPDAAGVRWIRALRDAPTLGAALERAGDDVDVAAWLGDAVRSGWIDGIDAVTTKETLT